MKTIFYALQRYILPALLLFMAALIPAHGADKSNIAEIIRLETLLLMPCQEPLEYMNELTRLGQSYQDEEKHRISLYRSALDSHLRLLSVFLVSDKVSAGEETGIFRARYDKLYSQAKNEGLLREASYSDISDGSSMADVAATVQQHSGQKTEYTGSWLKQQTGLGNKLFYTEAQRPEIEKIRAEMEQLHTDWQNAREEYLKKMATDPFRDVFGEIERRAAAMTGDIAPTYGKHKENLSKLFESGRFEHCLGTVVPVRTYAVKNIISGAVELAPYLPGSPGTFEALPGVGFRMTPPARFEPIKASPESIPEEFPLELPLKHDTQTHIKTAIEMLQVQANAEKEAIIATGNFLTGMDGWLAQAAGETFNVVHGFVEGFAGIGNILIGIAQAPFQPTETVEQITAIKDVVVKLYNDGDFRGGVIRGGVNSIAGFFTGVISGVELMASPGNPPQEQYDAAALTHWKIKAEQTELARKALTNAENLAGMILSDIATGLVISKGTNAAKLAEDAVDTASDISKAGLKAKKVEEATARAGKLADDVPNTKAIDALESEIKQCQNNIRNVIDDISAPKSKNIPYSEQMLPSPEDVLQKASTSTDKGGMNAYFKLNDDLGIKVGQKEIFKSSENPVTALISSASRDVDDAGRRFLEEITKDSSLGRLPQVKDRYYIVDDIMEGTKTYRSIDTIPDNTRYRVVEVIENIPPESHASNLAQANKLTHDHMRAYETFMRDMNDKGYVWTDAKLENFAFETIDPQKGLYRVVPLDTGGVYKVSNLPDGLSSGEIAGKLQRSFESSYELKDAPMETMMSHTLTEAEKLGVPGKVLDNLSDHLGMFEINNSLSGTPMATYAPGKRMTSPDLSYSSMYAKTAEKSTELLKKEVGGIVDACLADDPRMLVAQAALDAKKAQLASANAQLDKTLEQIEKSKDAALAAVAAQEKEASLLAAASLQLGLDAAGKAEQKTLCLAVMEKLLSGLEEEWLTKAWQQCQDLGFTFAPAK